MASDARRVGSLAFTAFFLLWTFVYAIFFVVACTVLPFRGRFALARVSAIGSKAPSGCRPAITSR